MVKYVIVDISIFNMEIQYCGVSFEAMLWSADEMLNAPFFSADEIIECNNIYIFSQLRFRSMCLFSFSWQKINLYV